MTLGLVSSLMSMMRPAPTFGPPVLMMPPYSSISTRYGRPLMVIGIAFFGMLIAGQDRRAMTGALGFVLRAWISEVSTMTRPLFGSGSRVPAMPPPGPTPAT